MTGFVCAYMGPPGECSECGGFNETGTQFCSPDCEADRADRVARQQADERVRRDADDAFGREVARLHAEGRTYEEIDELLKGMP